MISVVFYRKTLHNIMFQSSERVGKAVTGQMSADEAADGELPDSFEAMQVMHDAAACQYP